MEEVIQRVMPHSIEVQRAKDGTYYWTIKMYWESGEGGETVVSIKNLDAMLRQEFLGREE